MFRIWLESSLDDLFQSAVDAFPHTQKRQHATDPIVIDNVAITPYIGVRTLYVRAEAHNEGRHYRPMILFKNVQFGEGVQLVAADNGEAFQVHPISEQGADVRLRCQCGDFHWRFNYYDWVDRSLYGNKRAPYEARTDRGPVNPTESPGMCKHLMKLMYSLRDAGLLE